jgi:hypothetical protein
VYELIGKQKKLGGGGLVIEFVRYFKLEMYVCHSVCVGVSAWVWVRVGAWVCACVCVCD